jgi:hypothetical protein
MKKIIPLLTSSFLLLTFLPGCATTNIQWTDTTITAAVSFGTTEGLRLAIKDSAKRTEIANYITTYAGALRSISGTPTPDALLAAITQFIPASIRQQYPELQSIVFPVISSVYGQVYAKFGADHAKIYQVLNDIATGLESGSSPYISK